MTDPQAMQVKHLPVAVDVMGGDNGCDVIISGACQAACELGIASILVGDENEIRTKLKKFGRKVPGMLEVQHASQVVSMEDVPSKVIRSKTDSSMRIAFELVKQGRACGIVSTGNTGVMMAMGIFVSGTMSGIVRPAIASLIPRVAAEFPTVLLDCGANVDCHAQQLLQFAVMGDLYSRLALGCPKPRVALLSNGSEASKGTDVLRTTAMMLEGLPDLDCIGYVEGFDIPRDRADVVVCDGFVGNIVLKAMEGSVGLVFDSLRQYIKRHGRGRWRLWLAKPVFKSMFHDCLDPSEYGGAPLLGLNDIAIKCHGSANQRAVMYGIRVADRLNKQGLIEQMGAALERLENSVPAGAEQGIWNRMGEHFEKGKRAGRKFLRSKEVIDKPGEQQ